MVKRLSSTKIQAHKDRWGEVKKLRYGFIALLSSSFSTRPSNGDIEETSHTIDCIAALVEAPDDHSGVPFTVEFKALKRSPDTGTSFFVATYLANIEVDGLKWADLRDDWQPLAEHYMNFRVWPQFVELFSRANAQSIAEMKRLPSEVSSIRWLSGDEFVEQSLPSPTLYREVDGKPSKKKALRGKKQPTTQNE